MRTLLVTLLVSIAGLFMVPEPVNACGVKLTTRATNVPRRTANPSTVHVMAIENDGALRRALRQAGHNVVVSRTASDVDASSDVVLTTQARVDATRRNLPRNIVLPTAGSVRSILAAIEERLAQRSRTDAS